MNLLKSYYKWKARRWWKKWIIETYKANLNSEKPMILMDKKGLRYFEEWRKTYPTDEQQKEYIDALKDKYIK